MGKEKILQDLLPIEIHKESIEAGAKRAFASGKTYVSVLEKFTHKIFPNLIKKIEILEQSPLKQQLAAYMDAKRTLFETKLWFEWNVALLEKMSGESHADKKREVSAIIDRHAARIEQLTQVVNQSASSLFSKNYKPLTDKTFSKLKEELTSKSMMLEQYTEEQREAYSKNIDRSEKWLEQVGAHIATYRKQWLALLLKDGRGLNITCPDEFPYSILYTAKGTLFVLLESPEHFLGIGEGKIVCRAVDLEKEKILAAIKPRIIYGIKDVKDDEKNMRKKAFYLAWRESEFLTKLEGKDGILQVHERIVFEFNEIKHLYLLEELYKDLSLESQLQKTQLDLKAKTTLAHHLLEGLYSIEKAGIIHRDIKAANVLVDLNTSNAVIADFNLSCYAHEKSYLQQEAFSPWTCAPEYALAIIAKKEEELEKATTHKVDVWAVGTVLYQLFTDTKPFWMAELNSPKVISMVARLEKDWFPKELRKKPFAGLIQKMLAIDPAERITAKQALEEFED